MTASCSFLFFKIVAIVVGIEVESVGEGSGESLLPTIVIPGKGRIDIALDPEMYPDPKDNGYTSFQVLFTPFPINGGKPYLVLGKIFVSWGELVITHSYYMDEILNYEVKAGFTRMVENVARVLKDALQECLTGSTQTL